MITNFKIFEKVSNYNADDFVIVTSTRLGLNNRLVVIDSIIKDRNGISIKVWNAAENHNDEDFIISENNIIYDNKI